MKRYCLALDLKDNEELIAEYEELHRNVWPAVRSSIISSGIEEMEIYRVGNRLFMIIEASERFSFEAKNKLDSADPEVCRWEALMWQFQQQLPFAGEGEKWLLMNKIYSLQ